MNLRWLRRRTVQAGVVTFGVVLAIAAPAMAAESLPGPTFSKDVAPILQAKCQECHQPNSIAPMSLITYEETRPWARHQGARRGASDAAVAHRPQRRRPEVQERHVAERRADRHHRPLGRRGRAARRPEGHAAAQAARHRQRMESREGRLRPARHRRQVRSVHDGGATPGCVVAAHERPPAHRAALGQAGRDSSDDAEGPEDHPSLDRVSGAEQRPRRREHRHGERSVWIRPAPTTSWTGARS